LNERAYYFGLKFSCSQGFDRGGGGRPDGAARGGKLYRSLYTRRKTLTCHIKVVELETTAVSMATVAVAAIHTWVRLVP
jgi:hypothetical protein